MRFFIFGLLFAAVCMLAMTGAEETSDYDYNYNYYQEIARRAMMENEDKEQDERAMMENDDETELDERAVMDNDEEEELDERQILGGAGCYWAGTSPFCMAKCSKDFRTMGADKRGDGHPCLTGSKFFCCPPLPVTAPVAPAPAAPAPPPPPARTSTRI